MIKLSRGRGLLKCYPRLGHCGGPCELTGYASRDAASTVTSLPGGCSRRALPGRLFGIEAFTPTSGGYSGSPWRALSRHVKRCLGMPSFDAAGRQLLVLWGGRRGSTRNAAAAFRRAAQRLNFDAKLAPCSAVPFDALSQQGLVVVFCATYDGHPPDNAAAFLAEMQLAASCPHTSLGHLHFAVLCTCNRRWESTFAHVGEHIDDALERCGAQRLLPLERADKYDGLQRFEKQLTSWQEHLFTELAQPSRIGQASE